MPLRPHRGRSFAPALAGPAGFRPEAQFFVHGRRSVDERRVTCSERAPSGQHRADRLAAFERRAARTWHVAHVGAVEPRAGYHRRSWSLSQRRWPCPSRRRHANGCTGCGAPALHDSACTDISGTSHTRSTSSIDADHRGFTSIATGTPSLTTKSTPFTPTSPNKPDDRVSERAGADGQRGDHPPTHRQGRATSCSRSSDTRWRRRQDRRPAGARRRARTHAPAARPRTSTDPGTPSTNSCR